MKKRPDLSVYASPEEIAACRAGLEAKRIKAAARKAAHQERLANMTEEERALYDAKALRKREGRQRWLDEYRTLDKKTKKERRATKKKAAADRKASRATKREQRAIRKAQIEANREYRGHYKAHKNAWRNIQGQDAAQSKQLKRAEIARFKELHWGQSQYDKWYEANRKRREAYRRKKGIKEPLVGNYLLI